MSSYECPRCGCHTYDDPGLCYSCKRQDFLDGKCDSWGNSLVTEIKNDRLDELLEIERKYILIKTVMK
jgi:hypothetical protein